MTTAEQFAKIYDKLNAQPNIQELIATPLLQQLDLEDDQKLYIQRTLPWQDLNIYNLQAVIDDIGWDTDDYPGSFASYVLFVLKP